MNRNRKTADREAAMLAQLRQENNLDDMICVCEDHLEGARNHGTDRNLIRRLEYWENLLCGLALSLS